MERWREFKVLLKSILHFEKADNSFKLTSVRFILFGSVDHLGKIGDIFCYVYLINIAVMNVGGLVSGFGRKKRYQILN